MKFSISNKNWILFSTAGVIGIAFAVYFLVYVKGKEEDIVSNNFRVLQQVVQNINSLEESYLKNAISLNNSKDSNSKEVNKNIKEITAVQRSKVKKLYLKHNEGILYGDVGIYFIVGGGKNNIDSNFYFTSYNKFFNNELFHRKDVFDQIIITSIDSIDGINIKERNVLYSSGPLAIMDSVFYKKKLRAAKDEIKLNDKEYISFNLKIYDSNVIVSGLVLKSTFEQQKRSVSPFVIFALSIALILIILAMPILKLKIMSLEERLHIKDVVFNIISMLIGPAILIVFFYTSYVSYGDESDELELKLDLLSNKIERNFQVELGQIVNQIDTLNANFINNSSFLKFAIEKDSANGNIIEDSLIYFKHLKAIFWCTKNADVNYFRSVFDIKIPPQNLGHRKYITNIIDNIPTYFKDTSQIVHEIGIESIKSVSDGAYEVGIGMASVAEDYPVVAISSKISSTMGTILEEGYGFCILDKKGNTVFHSDIMKNMNENFIQETQNEFFESMASHTSVVKTLNYNGIEQKIYFRPLNCLSDHYIATFVNEELQYGPFTLSMISAFSMFLSFLVFLFIVYIIMYLSSFQSTKLKQVAFIFFFIRPYENDSCHKIYKSIITLSYVIIGYFLCTIALNLPHYDFIISELVIVIVVLLISSFYALSKSIYDEKLIFKGLKRPSTIAYSIVLFSIVCFMVYRFIFIAINHSDAFILLLNSFVGVLIVILIIIKIFFQQKVSELFSRKMKRRLFSYKMIRRFTDLIIFIKDVINSIKNFLLQILHKLQLIETSETKSTCQIQQDYLHFLILWLIIISIIPINIFVQITYKKEEEIIAKFRGLQLLYNARDWDFNTKNEFANRFIESNEKPSHYDLFVNSMKRDSLNYALIETKLENKGIHLFTYLRDEYSSIIDDSVTVRSKDSIKYNINEVDIDEIKNVIYWKIDATKVKDVIKIINDSVFIRSKDSTSYDINKVDVNEENKIIKWMADTTIAFLSESRIFNDSILIRSVDLNTYLKREVEIEKSDSIISWPLDTIDPVDSADLKKYENSIYYTSTKIENDSGRDSSGWIIDTLIRFNDATIHNINAVKLWYNDSLYDINNYVIDSAKNIVKGKVDTLLVSINEVNRTDDSIKLRSRDYSRFVRGEIVSDSENKETEVKFVGNLESVRRTDDSVFIRRIDSIKYSHNDVKFNHDSSSVIVNNAIIFESKKARITSAIGRSKHYHKETFDSLYSYFRPNYNERSSITSSFVGEIAADHTWIFSSGKDNNVLTINPAFKEESYYTNIIIPSKVDFLLDHWAMSLMVTILTIIIFYNILKFNLLKVYGFKYKIYADKNKQFSSSSFAKYFLNEKFFSNNSSYNNIFIVGVNSAHTSFIKTYFSGLDKDKYRILDFYDFNEKLGSKVNDLTIVQSETKSRTEIKRSHFERSWTDIKQLIEESKSNVTSESSTKEIYILIEHFEFGYNDTKLNKLKLKMLKYLLSCKNFKVLVKSEINPAKLLDFYVEEIKKIDNILKNSNVGDRIKLQKMMNELRVDYKKWQHLLGSFVKCIIPINKIDYNTNSKEINSLTNELAHGEFLDVVKKYVKKIPDLDLPDEDKILSIQQMSYPYYFSVWNSLSREERYIAYDIAKDRFVNTVNTNAIISLLDKGLLIYDHSLRLMNESFTNFVLTTVSSDEALEMEMISRKKGTWNTAMAVILLLIISIIIFLSFGQQNFLNDINAFLTGIAALVGLLLRFSGFLSFGGNKGATA